MSRNPYALSRLAKERHPESYCPDKRCLWLVKTNKGLRPCPRHMQNTPHNVDTSADASNSDSGNGASVRPECDRVVTYRTLDKTRVRIWPIPVGFDPPLTVQDPFDGTVFYLVSVDPILRPDDFRELREAKAARVIAFAERTGGAA